MQLMSCTAYQTSKCRFSSTKLPSLHRKYKNLSNIQAFGLKKYHISLEQGWETL